jgi:hypothetical protein
MLHDVTLRSVALAACTTVMSACGGPATKADAEAAARRELIEFCERERCAVEKFELLGGTQEDDEWSVEFRTKDPTPLRVVFTFQRNGFVNTSTLRD